MSHRWSELRVLFDELVELAEGARAARLREIGARDEALRARLETMLEAEAGSVMHDFEKAAARSILAATAPGGERDPLGLLGATVGRYRIDGLLGAGGMGVVYRATDIRLGRIAALKLLPPAWTLDDIAKRRFLQEARAASSLDHANVCTIYEADETADGALYIAMTCYEGETLRDRMKRGPLEVGEALELTVQAARGLAAAHARGLVHRDIKPANLLVTTDGTLKILDFGVAKVTDVALTMPEQRPGTVAYMSPEQASGEAVDGRSDIWSLGLVLYEMLTGRRPVTAAYAGELVAAPSTLRPEVGPAIDDLVLRLLAHAPGDRPAGATEVVQTLERHAAEAAARRHTGLSALLRAHPAWFTAATLAVVSVVLGGAAFALRAFGPDGIAAQELNTRIEELAAEGRFVEAFELAELAERRHGEDALPVELLSEIADWITVTSEPGGARVLALRYAADAPEPVGDIEWQVLGTTPLDSIRVPRGDYILRVEHAGFATVEQSASSALLRLMPDLPRIVHRAVAAPELHGELPGTGIRVDVRLLPSADMPDDMVFVPGGPYEIVSRDLAGSAAALDDFFLDRFEVTNARFAEFVHAGGYANPDFWRDLTSADPVGWRSALDALTDRTGLPGPRDWIGQQHAAQLADHPVTGATWYEAAAYCRFRGRRLPTLFEWEKTARDGLISRFDGMIMPWGYQSYDASPEPRANFSGTGTAPVDAHAFGLSPFGAHGMAGNAKEWLSNTTGRGRAVTGGSWEDPIYMFSQIGSVDPLFASPSVGFRCAMLARHSDPAADQGDGFLEIDLPTPVYEPVDERTFEMLLTHFRYDRRPLDADVLERIETPSWTREKVAFNGPAGDRILAYLYLPHAAKPPFQTLVYTPGYGAFLGNTLAFETEWILGPLIRSGHAAFSVVMSGMTEREWGPDQHMPEQNTVGFRDLMVLHATELRFGLDYLETRAEIDTSAIGYVGVSMGAGSRLAWAAVDDRFRAVILIGAGIDERMQPTVEEASNVNFAPYIRAPTLMLNGRDDEEHLWERRALPLWNLLSEPKELVLVEGAGHVPPPEERVPAMLRWLERVLGPVRR